MKQLVKLGVLTHKLIKPQLFSSSSLARFSSSKFTLNTLQSERLEIVKKDGDELLINYEKFPESEYDKILNDEELIETSLKNSSDYNINMLTYQLIKYQSKLLTSNSNIMKIILSRNGNLLKYFPNYQNDRELVKIALQSNVQAFEFASQELRSDFELCNMALSINGSLMKYVTNEDVKNNKGIALNSIKNSETSFRYLSENLKSNLEFCKIVLKSNYRIFPYLPYELRNDESIFKLQPKVESLPFEYFGEDIKKNINFQKSMLQRGNSLSLILPYNTSIDIQQFAIKCNPENIDHVYNEIKLNREFIKECAKETNLTFNYVYNEFYNDREMSLWFCKCNAFNYAYINPLFEQDDQIKWVSTLEFFDRKYIENDIDLLKMFPEGLKYASETLKNNKRLVLYFIKQFNFNFNHASNGLKDDIDVVELALSRRYFRALEQTSLKLERNFILKMIEKSEGIPMRYFPSNSEFRKDPQVVMNTSKYRIYNIDGADEELLNNFQFIKQLLEQTYDNSGCIYQYVGSELKSNWEFIKYCVERNYCELYFIDKNYIVDYIELLEICIEKGEDPFRYIKGDILDERVLDLIEKYPQYMCTVYNILKYSKPEITMKINLVKYFTNIQEKYGNELKNSNEFKEFYMNFQEWKQDRELAKLVLKHQGHLLQFLNLELRNDVEIVQIAMEENEMNILFASEQIQSQYENIHFILKQVENSKIISIPKIENNDENNITKQRWSIIPSILRFFNDTFTFFRNSNK
ncbi:predicted protein [Naegleria gruberi]|uniref:Predicted protein n=1 Tax=Naegleria gruberi TaxID=5762 RepID=D2V5B5_NAEGR|nr:uncharacterized protein NAEGRDRAFT_64081 [Naegleria gruberi]EFC48245.1 predicted protein [Naegleria gruberi]|eukprot:XP_002680989.1 predicted protein [Naegleria gruberi strain NEG-M]